MKQPIDDLRLTIDDSEHASSVVNRKSSIYPATPAERNRWILKQRQNVPRAALNAFAPHAFWVEDERAENGEIVPVAALLLTNSECPWKCLMCDLWRHTLTESVPRGAIPAQITLALKQLPAARQIKLYNSGSFFDPHAIPPEDYPLIAACLAGFECVIVECHPKLIGDACWRFRDLLSAHNVALEVAIGLETVHPEVSERLNKRATPADFAGAAQKLRENGVALRAFALIKPPFMDENEALFWAARSTDFAFDCGASVVALIPTRRGNGALEALEARGEWAPPRLQTLEAATDYGVALQRGRVFADLWDLEQFSTCAHCFEARRVRLQTMNFEQQVLPPVTCSFCAHEN